MVRSRAVALQVPLPGPLLASCCQPALVPHNEPPALAVPSLLLPLLQGCTVQGLVHATESGWKGILHPSNQCVQSAAAALLLQLLCACDGGRLVVMVLLLCLLLWYAAGGAATRGTARTQCCCPCMIIIAGCWTPSAPPTYRPRRGPLCMSPTGTRASSEAAITPQAASALTSDSETQQAPTAARSIAHAQTQQQAVKSCCSAGLVSGSRAAATACACSVATRQRSIAALRSAHLHCGFCKRECVKLSSV